MGYSNPVSDVGTQVNRIPQPVITVDLNGNYEGGGTQSAPSYVRIADNAVVGNVATVAQFHNTDNQALPSTAYGLLGGGVAQLLNQAGNLDRQRETSIDGIAAVGIATGAAQFAMSFKTTDTTDTFTAGTRTFTPVAMSGTVQGVAWSIQVGTVLSLDTGANQEYVIVTATTSTTFTCVTTKTHTATFSIIGFVYNQERDAAGEVDGATGIGTAVAAEYEYNGGGPLNNANAISNLQFDRARNVQALGLGSGTISNNPLAAGSTTLTLNSAPTTLQPGVPVILDRVGANPETNYVALNYTVGSTSVPLANATANSHAQNSTVEWGQHSPLGAQLNGFLPWGLGAEEEVVYDPASKKWYIEIAATADANSGQNLVVESIGNFNGTTFDRQRGNYDNVTVINASAVTTTQTSADQVNYNARGLYIIVNVTTLTGTSPTLTPALQGKDPVSVQYFQLGANATAISATGKYVYYYSLNAPAAAGGVTASIAFQVPRTWNFVMTAGGTITNATYTVAASYML